jgi:hypothetical protein
MKIQIAAELIGDEIINNFLKHLKENGIDGTIDNVKIMVFSKKSGEDVEVKADQIKILFNKP